MSDDDEYSDWPTINASADTVIPHSKVRIVCDTRAGDITLTIPPGGENWEFSIRNKGNGAVWLRRRVAARSSGRA